MNAGWLRVFRGRNFPEMRGIFIKALDPPMRNAYQGLTGEVAERLKARPC